VLAHFYSLSAVQGASKSFTLSKQQPKQRYASCNRRKFLGRCVCSSTVVCVVVCCCALLVCGVLAAAFPSAAGAALRHVVLCDTNPILRIDTDVFQPPQQRRQRSPRPRRRPRPDARHMYVVWWSQIVERTFRYCCFGYCTTPSRCFLESAMLPFSLSYARLFAFRFLSFDGWRCQCDGDLLRALV